MLNHLCFVQTIEIYFCFSALGWVSCEEYIYRKHPMGRSQYHFIYVYPETFSYCKVLVKGFSVYTIQKQHSNLIGTADTF